MGEVYRARDTALDRDVALKVLPEALAQDPDRLRRFEREAKALAALNHPNIGQIHAIERSSAGPGARDGAGDRPAARFENGRRPRAYRPFIGPIVHRSYRPIVPPATTVAACRSAASSSLTFSKVELRSSNAPTNRS
ncbi:MAG TPA: hypothetical protein VLD67_12870 [Vicinamibacterales bacterium]|nr:hypothetical protein [Vicinamibacterales bacterium]